MLQGPWEERSFDDLFPTHRSVSVGNWSHQHQEIQKGDPILIVMDLFSSYLTLQYFFFENGPFFFFCILYWSQLMERGRTLEHRLGDLKKNKKVEFNYE